MEFYINEPGHGELALDRIKPKDPGLHRVISFMLGTVIKRGALNVEARPITIDTPPEAVEMGRRAVESIVFDPKRGWERAERRAALGALSASAWGFRIGFNSLTGLTYHSEHPENILWAEGFLSPHEPDCPWAMRLCRVPVRQAELILGRKGIKPDSGPGQRKDRTTQETDSDPSMKRGKAEFVTLCYLYSRFEQKAPKKPKEPLSLEPEMFHLACAECGWSSPPQAESIEPYAEGTPCPDCGSPTSLISAVPAKNPDNAYTNGKRLTITAPLSQDDNEPPYYDDDWEFDYDFFPVDLLVLHAPPHKPFGQSVTSLLKTPVLAKCALIRLTYETLICSKPRWLLPAPGAVTNVYGAPYNFQPDDGDIMFYGGSPGDVSIVQGQGVNGSVFQMMDRFDTQFRTNERTSEVAMTPAQIADAKVGALEIHEESGNVSVDDLIRVLNEMRGRQLTNTACALREMPSREARYLAADGSWQFQRVGGPGMPPFEIIVAAGHALSDMDRDEILAYRELVGMHPNDRVGYAKLKHIDPSVLLSLPFNPNAAGAAPSGPPAPPGPAAAEQEVMNG